MVLGKEEILNEIKRGNLKIEPFSSNNIKGSSIDLTLDDKFWKFPGGRQLDDNNFLENAKREVKEELGIDVTLEKKPCIMAFERDKDNIKEYVILIHYLAKRKGEIKMGRDVREYRWLNIKKLPEDCAPNIKPVLNYFNKRL